MSILLTGFNEFGELQMNPSQAIVRVVAQRAASKSQDNLVTEVLPTEFRAAGARIRALIRNLEPESVVSLGVSSWVDAICLERVALNLDDTQEPDNAGEVRACQLVVPDGPVAYWSTLPLEQLYGALRERGIPVRYSNHAGTFVCNHVFYVARHEIEELGLDAECGFIHVPLMTEQLDMPDAGLFSLPFDTMVEAVECCLALLQNQRTLKED